MTYPVNENNEGYNTQVVKILFIPHREDINTSKGQTPHKLQYTRQIHVAEIERGHNTLSRLDDVKKTHMTPAQAILKSIQ